LVATAICIKFEIGNIRRSTYLFRLQLFYKNGWI